MKKVLYALNRRRTCHYFLKGIVLVLFRKEYSMTGLNTSKGII